MTLTAIILAVGLPLILAFLLVRADMRSDLSELKPARALADSSITLIGWPDLRNHRGRVRMIGYMMDGNQPSRDGEQVRMFVLMPEAGQFLHPAHRIPDEMVEVWTRYPATFIYRKLVWASGILEDTTGRPEPERAAFAMKDAEVEPAADRDLIHWFNP